MKLDADTRFWITLLLCAWLLSGCANVADPHPRPSQVWPDASTPVGHTDINGGIMDNLLVIDGVPYDTVTPALASKVARWQGSTKGFVIDNRPLWDGATAIPKATMFAYDTHGW